MDTTNANPASLGRPHFSPRHLTLSLVSVFIGSLVLRAAAGAMGEDIQFYFSAIDRAAHNPRHPLWAVAGAQHVHPISYTLGGVIIVSFFASELLGSVVFGAWSDHYGRKLFIVLGPLLGALAVQITAMTTLVWLLVVTRLLEGLSTASNVPATLGYIAEATAHSPKLRSRMAGLYEIATIGGMALGFVLGSWLWRTFGAAAFFAGIPLTSPAFAVNALVYLASSVVLWLGIHDLHEKPASEKPVTTARQTLERYWHIANSPRVASLAPAWIALNGVLGLWINLTARLLTDNSGFPGQLLVGRFSSFQAGGIRAGLAAVLVLGILLWSQILAGMRKTTAMLIGTGGLFAVCLALVGINHQQALNAPLVIPLVIALVLALLTMSAFTPAALAYLSDVTEDHAADRGMIMGLYSVFLGLGQFLGVALGGPFVDWLGLDGLAIAVAILGVFAAFVLVLLHVSENARIAT